MAKRKGCAAAQASEVEAIEDVAVVEKERPLRPAQCRAHMRREIAKQYRGIVRGVLEAAKKGSCPHVKLATELVERPARAQARRGKNVLDQLIEDLEGME